MDIDERIALLAGIDTWHTPAVGDVPAIRMSDGPAGVRGTDWAGPASASFPCGTALAATFDPDLVREVGEALGREAHSKSANVLLAPTVNLHRTPIGGRNFECMSEDPVHTAVMSSAYIEGVQSQGVACCVKHFVGNDTEFARMVVSSEIPERVLRELYLVPFEAAVAAGVHSVMTGYNRLNGTYCSEHEWLLDTVLRGEWGFDGAVISDWFGTHSTAEALRAGLDVEMPGPPRHRGVHLRRAYDAGAVDDGHVDTAVGRVRQLAERTGARQTITDEFTADDPVTRAVIRRAAAAAAVLLKNDAAGLPLAAGSRLALIGPYAATGRVQGGGSAKVRPDRPSALIDALRARQFEVEHAPGCHIDKFLPLLRGDFRVELFDADGNSMTDDRNRLQLVRQHQAADGIGDSFGATITGTFVPDEGGEWRIGLRSVGAATVRFDGQEVIAVGAGATGGSFFGYGSDEVFGTVELVDGQPVKVEVEYPQAPSDGMRGVLVGGRPTSSTDLVAEAVALARNADVAVVVVGTDDDWETEAEDRTTIALPGRQDELVSAVAAVAAATVVVVNAGSPVAMPWLDEVDSVLDIWFPGGQLGLAVTDVLSGDVEPGGRLPVTFPRQLADTPAFEHHPGDGVTAHYAEGLLIGHRWYDRHGIEPLFPFGHGLGYTTFALTSPRLVDIRDRGGWSSDARIDVEVDVVNTGARPGSEVVQVYTRYRGDHPEVEPILRFAGSAKLTVVPGATVTAMVPLDRRRFESWLDGMWTMPAGVHEVLVGRSSADLVAVGEIRT
jgi:beta-glucosidase